MNSDPASIAPLSAAPDLTPATQPPSLLRKIFFGPNGIRAGWRLLLFLATFAALQFAIIQIVMRRIPYFVQLARQAQTGGVLTPQFSLIFESTILVLVLFAAWIMSRIEKRPFGAYGIPLQGAFGKLFWQGVIWGLAFETIEMLVMSALGGFSFGNLALAGIALLKYAILWAIAFTFVGLFEEFLFRGYAQFTLGSGIGFWPAAFLLSAAFGAVHLSNPGEGWVGALSVFVFGMFGCFTLRRTGNLWFAIGLHAAADYAETFIYSVPDSGLLATGHLLNSTLHGPRWLTGGSIGPEGSLIDFILFAAAFLLFHFTYSPQKSPTPSS
jgi:membrane protease YdiL (CAAX protease family)